MIIEGVDSGAFIRALLALSAAYMDRVIMWNRDFMPRVHRGVDFAMESKFRGSYDFIVSKDRCFGFDRFGNCKCICNLGVTQTWVLGLL